MLLTIDTIAIFRDPARRSHIPQQLVTSGMFSVQEESKALHFLVTFKSLRLKKRKKSFIPPWATSIRPVCENQRRLFLAVF